MKKFTRLMSLLLAGTMLLGTAGCNKGNETPADGENGTVENQADGEILTWGTNAEFPPYEYREGNEVVGIDAEMVDAIAGKLGMKAQVEDMNFDSIVASIQSGKVDMGVAGMTVTEDR